MYANAFMSNLFPVQPVYVENKKGADSFLSTTNYCLDFYTFNSKKVPTDLVAFTKIVRDLEQAKNQNPEIFMKLLKFHRLIEKGNGIRWIYYLSMMLLRLEDQPTYEKLLEWSWEYPKDIHNLHKMNHSVMPFSCVSPTQVSMTIDSARIRRWVTKSNGVLFPSNPVLLCNRKRRTKAKPTTYNVSISPETKLYGDLVFKMLKGLLSNDKDGYFNPMLVKYLAFENGLWLTETVLVWNYVNSLFHSNPDVFALISSNDELSMEIATNFRNILQRIVNSSTFTRETNLFSNKTRRLIKVLFNHHVNITDNMFSGIHTDGSMFGSHKNQDDEISMIYDVLRKTPSISNKLCSKTIQNIQKIIQKSINSDVSGVIMPSKHDVRNDLIIKGYIKYVESLKSGKTVAKVRGVDLTSECFQYFTNSNEENDSLEYKLAEMFKQLQSYLMPCFNEEFTYEAFANNVVLVLDHSGSMSGKPLETGLLYMLMMVKLFRVKTLYFFDCTTKTKILTDVDIDGTFLDLIKKIYINTSGSTNLASVLDVLDKNNICGKNVIVITDGDCDPSYDVSGRSERKKSPFHEATDINGKYKQLYTNFYLVVNVKKEKMAFPYLAIDPKVCYLTGNNPKTMRGFIKAMIMSMKNNTQITPELIMQYSIDYEELQLPVSVPSYSAVLSEEDVKKLFDAFMENLPPKKAGDSGDKADDSDNDSDNDSDWS